MHILFFTDNFPPESNAPATRTYEHAKRWVASGHKVTVVTCWPNFPSGKIYSGYKNKWIGRESVDGIDVVRVKTFMTANERFMRRVFDYVSFMISGSVAGLFIKKADVVVATTPQFFCAVGGLIVSRLKRKPFVLEVRDLWPESIVALGVMKDRWSIRILEKIEQLLYRKAEAIVVVTPAFVKEIVARGGKQKKISVVLNGVEHLNFMPRPKPQYLTSKYGLENKFTVGYIGTHGLAHDLENMLSAAEQLAKYPHIQFMFVGAGAMREHVEDIVKAKALENVTLVPQQSREKIADHLALCDLSLIPLKDRDLFSTVIPSKIFECMAMGIPMLASLPDGVATEIIRSENAGFCIQPEKPDLVANKILELSKSESKLGVVADAAKAGSLNYTREKMAEKLLKTIERIGHSGA